MLLLTELLRSNPGISNPDQCCRAFLPLFSYSFTVSGIILKSFISFEFVSIFGLKKRVQFHSAYKYSVFSISFIKDTALSFLCVHGSFVKNQLHINSWFYFWTFCLATGLFILGFLCQYYAVLNTISTGVYPREKRLI